MQDTLISIKTAKLALEVGSNVGPSIFNWEVEHLDNSKVKIIELNLIINLEDFKEDLRLPTQSLLQKWLREKHNIHIEVSPWLQEDGSNEGYGLMIYKTWKERIECELKLIESKNQIQLKQTYEEALEEGLYESLKLIKNEKTN